MAKILIVEDDKELLKIMTLELSHEGFETDSAEDGRDALEKIQCEKPDLVLLDVMLPRLSGLEVLRKIRREIDEDGSPKAKKYTAREIVDGGYNLDLCGFPHEEEEILPPKELIQEYQEKRASLNADIDRILEQITGILGINTEDLS